MAHPDHKPPSPPFAPPAHTKWRVTSAQKEALLAAFQDDPYPDLSRKNTLATQLGVTPTQISKWFQHRRESLSRLGQFKAQYNRTRRTPEQLDVLQAAFDVDRYPAPEKLAQLEEQLDGVTAKQIKLWFKHRRKQIQKRSRVTTSPLAHPPSPPRLDFPPQYISPTPPSSYYYKPPAPFSEPEIMALRAAHIVVAGTPPPDAIARLATMLNRPAALVADWFRPAPASASSPLPPDQSGSAPGNPAPPAPGAPPPHQQQVYMPAAPLALPLQQQQQQHQQQPPHQQQQQQPQPHHAQHPHAQSRDVLPVNVNTNYTASSATAALSHIHSDGAPSPTTPPMSAYDAAAAKMPGSIEDAQAKDAAAVAAKIEPFHQPDVMQQVASQPPQSYSYLYQPPPVGSLQSMQTPMHGVNNVQAMVHGVQNVPFSAAGMGSAGGAVNNSGNSVPASSSSSAPLLAPLRYISQYPSSNAMWYSAPSYSKS